MKVDIRSFVGVWRGCEEHPAKLARVLVENHPQLENKLERVNKSKSFTYAMSKEYAEELVKFHGLATPKRWDELGDDWTPAEDGYYAKRRDGIKIAEDEMEISDKSVQIFNNGEFQLKAVDRNGSPWFIARKVCETLGITWSGDRTLAELDESWKGVVNFTTPGGKQDVRVISEPGLYCLVGRSTKPQARQFMKWVYEEVLPSIRKTGKYEAKPLSGIDFLQYQLDIIREQNLKLDLLKQDIRQIAASVPTKEDIKQGYNEAIKEKAKHSDMPEHLIDLSGIAKRLNYAVNELVLRDAYDALGHPRGSWTYLDKNGDVRPVESFEKDCLGETELHFLSSIKVSKATESNYIATSEYVLNSAGAPRRFYIKKDIAKNDPKIWDDILRKFESSKFSIVKKRD
jgi:prophage antirepressor-like protein